MLSANSSVSGNRSAVTYTHRQDSHGVFMVEPQAEAPTLQLLLNIALRWDGLIFCLLGTDLFVRAYESNTTEYCSPALLNALVSLGAVLELPNQFTLPASYTQATTRGSEAFEEAISIIRSKERIDNFADAQAIGVLSLRQAISGYYDCAEALAEEYAYQATTLCATIPRPHIWPENHIRVRASTYCSAVSSVRCVLSCFHQCP